MNGQHKPAALAFLLTLEQEHDAAKAEFLGAGFIHDGANDADVCFGSDTCEEHFGFSTPENPAVAEDILREIRRFFQELMESDE